MSRFKMYVVIPVRPHVRQYLEQNVFLKKKEFVLTSTTTVGSFLMKLVEPKKKALLPLRYNPDNTIQVLLTDNYNFVVRPYLSPQKADQFNLFVERKLKEEMYVFIDCMCRYCGKDINQAIAEFQNKYGFNDNDLSFDLCKQSYFRYRKALKSRNGKAA